MVTATKAQPTLMRTASPRHTINTTIIYRRVGGNKADARRFLPVWLSGEASDIGPSKGASLERTLPPMPAVEAFDNGVEQIVRDARGDDGGFMPKA
jgi:hypothetical protein